MTLPKKCRIAPLFLLAFMTDVLAGHPFVTDDTSTQGLDKQQFEANTDRARQSGTVLQVGHFIYSYGTLQNLDLFVDLPATFSSPAGVNDVSAGLKWRFYEDGASSFALKSALLFPSGNQRLGYGSGRSNLVLTLIGSRYTAPWAWHANLGLSTNRQAADSINVGQHSLLWQASAALAYDFNRHWKTLADLGIARNPDPARGPHPAYFLTGIIYSPDTAVELDAGLKFGLNRTASDHQIGVGLTWRF
ncbi:MAG TPA: transporter [Burkholderiaceae bacterium]|nr:transporter [Burkholderiaceae bacterium]